ncbi:GntR family transcriptional regulator [Streptomyces sp. NBC_00028]|uniref:GntR family transcriptional regulator n=1 Tax=Streptomyces sp. NBC_00028 TaxID=2975624 RepID=UPI00324E883A
MTDIDSQFLRGLFDEEGSLYAGRGTALYRLYGVEGLLYVGISTCPLTRVRTHLRDKPWGPDVIGIRIEYPADAAEAERHTIRSERPRHNGTYNGRPEEIWTRLADRLRADITAGRMLPGERLPSPRRLAAAEGVAVWVGERAYQVLRERGLVRAVPRKGWVVAAGRDRAG